MNPATRRRLARLLSAWLAVGLGGSACSFALVREPPARGHINPGDCSTSMAIPMIDALAASLGVLAIGYGMYKGASTPAVLGGVAQVTLFLASAGYGSNRVNRCLERLERQSVPHKHPGQSQLLLHPVRVAPPEAPDASGAADGGIAPGPDAASGASSLPDGGT